MSHKSTVWTALTALILSAAFLLWGIPIARGEHSLPITPTPAPVLDPDPPSPAPGDPGYPCASVEELVWLAEQRLPELFMVASADPDGFGMGADAALADIRLLTPYQVYWPTSPDEGVTLDDKATMSSLVPTGQWCIPVVWGDGAGAIIRAHCSPEGWRVTGVGGKNELISVRHALRALGKGDALDGGSPASPAFYFVQGYPRSPDVVLAETSRGIRAVSLDAAAITRSLEGHDIDTEPGADAIHEMLQTR